jgi:hypothetical protein
MGLFALVSTLLTASAADRLAFYADADQDGYGDPRAVRYSTRPTGDYTVLRAGDCNDTDALVHRGAFEFCSNGHDDDCDGEVDECDMSLDDAALFVTSSSRATAPRGPLAVADMDGDGTGDLVIGSFGAGARLLYGPASGTVDVDDAVAIDTTAPHDWFGWAVAGGDADGNGFDDLLVGAPNHSPSTTYLFLGPVTSDRDARHADAVLTSRNADYSGLALLVTTDHDGDGSADIVVGAGAGGGDYDGAVYVAAGASTGTLDLEVDATYAYLGDDFDFLGYDLADLGDVSGDGVSDLAIGAPWGFVRDGYILIVDGGSAPGTYLAEDIASASVSGEYLMGRRIQAVDYDGDGSLDLIAQDRPTETGGVVAWLGPFVGSMDVTDAAASWEWTSAWSATSLGDAFAAADFDGDGETDLIIGASGNYSGDDSGAVFFQWGIASGLVDVGSLPYVTGAFDGASLGFDVAALPDWNGDGIPEIAIGASSGAGHTNGAIYGFFSGVSY